jgi:site-specific DNA recombinase
MMAPPEMGGPGRRCERCDRGLTVNLWRRKATAMPRKALSARYLNPPSAREPKARGLDQPLGRCFAYCRVSTEEQSTQGQSLQVQADQLRAWAAQHRHELQDVVMEAGVSGAVPFHERPAGGRLWAELQAGDTLVACKVDRLSRSVIDCLSLVEELNARRIRLYVLELFGGSEAISGNGMAGAFLAMAAVFAKLERDKISERIRATKQRQKAAGEWSGGIPPFGWRVVDGKLVRVPELQRAIAKMRRLRKQGMSLYAIADAMRADGVSISHQGVKNAIGRAGR